MEHTKLSALNWGQTIYFSALFLVLALFCGLACFLCLCLGSCGLGGCWKRQRVDGEAYMQFSQMSSNYSPVHLAKMEQQQVPTVVMMQQYPQQYAMAGTSGSQYGSLCPPDRTLWMGSIDNEKWDAKFITEAFGSFGFQVQNVKMVTEKGSDRLASYCFVEFVDSQNARNAMLKANGRTVPNDPERRRFNLSFANSPEPHNEYNLFVNNLSSSVDDVELFKLFGEKYKSCRGAKVYRSYDGTSKRSGFVRFIDETDQQLALIEMNKFKVRGRELFLKLAQPKSRGQAGRGGRDYSGNNHSGGYSNRNYSSRSRHRSRSPRRSPSSRKHYIEPTEPATADEHNDYVFAADEDFQFAMDSARFSKYLIPVDIRNDDLAVKLYE